MKGNKAIILALFIARATFLCNLALKPVLDLGKILPLLEIYFCNNSTFL